MDKYINSTKVLNFIQDCLNHEDKISDTEKATLIAIQRYIERTQIADVESVRHGRWVKDCDRVMGDGWTYTQRHCSECGGQSVECVNYCQFCGARMDKDGDTL